MPAFLPALISAGVSLGSAALAARNKPDIPEPKEPRDFYSAEREFYRDIVAGGDPLREQRDRIALDRLLSNADNDIIGPTAASTLAFRKDTAEETGDQISDYMLQSSLMEQERVLGADRRLAEINTARQLDLDEYEQLRLKQEATQEVVDANFSAGLFRSTAGLINTGIEAYYDSQQPGADPYGNLFSMDEEALNPFTSEVGGNDQSIPNMFSGGEFNEPSQGLGFAREDFRDLLTAEYPFTSRLRTNPLF